MASVTIPDCPKCGGRSITQGELFYCRRCSMLHDGDPNEGGDHDSRNPAARLERAERSRGKFNKRR